MKVGKGFDRDVNCIIMPDPVTSNTTVTSFTSVGRMFYNATTTSFTTASGTLNFASGSTGSTVVTGTLTAFQQEFVVGDTITIGVSSYSTVSSWIIQAIPSQTQMTITGPAFLTSSAGTSLFVKVNPGIAFGVA